MRTKQEMEWIEKVSQNGDALSEISAGDQWKELVLAAVRNKGRAILHAAPSFQTEEVHIAAVQQDHGVYLLLPDEYRTPAVRRAAIIGNVWLLKDMLQDELDHALQTELYDLALGIEPMVMELLPWAERTRQRCSAAFKKNPDSIIHFPTGFREGFEKK